jgi:hypothetical protein
MRKICRAKPAGEYVRSGHDHQTFDALSLDEMVHDVCAHVGSTDVQLEQCVVVAHRHCSLYVESVLDCWILLLFRC